MLPRFTLPLFLALTSFAFAVEPAPRLKVGDDHRTLVTADGKPWVYLGDTAWELFHRLNREDADAYLADRAGKGFNVIQAVALAEFGGLVEANAYGHLPLENNDPTKPLEPYFQHVDYIVNKAASLGMHVGFLPTWGDKVNKKWGKGPEIFTPENARIFGEWLGRRYKDKPIIWIVGGDRPVENPAHLEIWRFMAAGLRAGDGGAHLITYHPMGGRSSSEYVHAESWLDFNMMQSGHGDRNRPSYKMIAKDLALTPPKPTLDGEPAYEDHPVRSDKTKTQWFDEWDVRKLCYWGLLAGACGHTYGTHSIWAMWDGKGKPPVDQRTPWKEALKLPGATQVGYAKKLLENRPLVGRVPDQTLLVSDLGDGAAHCQALRGADSSWAIIYSASGRSFGVVLGKFPAKRLNAAWFDPRTGKKLVPTTIANDGEPREFTPPTSGDAQDWVLLLDTAP